MVTITLKDVSSMGYYQNNKNTFQQKWDKKN